MSFFSKIKSKISGKGGSSSSPASSGQQQPEPSSGAGKDQPEATFTIQPHPAKTNDPRDLEPPQTGGGLNTNPELAAFQTPGPYLPSQEILKSIEQPKTQEELQARTQELNSSD